ncbi:MAG: hypothetical protein AAF982_12465, partial [Pseudomonadota bacterium]
ADDLLSSIRRLVTNEVSQALNHPVSPSGEVESTRAMRPALLLTPDFRVKTGPKDDLETARTTADEACMNEVPEHTARGTGEDVPIISDRGRSGTLEDAASPDDERRRDAGGPPEGGGRKTVSNTSPENRHPRRDVPADFDASSAPAAVVGPGDDMRPSKNLRRQRLPSEIPAAESYYEDEHVELPGREASLVALREALAQTPGGQPEAEAENAAGFETDEGHVMAEDGPGKTSTPEPLAATAADMAENADQKRGRDGGGEADDDVNASDRNQTASDILDEPALRAMVGQLIRQELQGPLGERITRNVRKLVRREIHRAIASRDFE